MAYSGSGTKSDPYIVDNWADFLTVENLRYGIYIKWADKENPEDKVVPELTINPNDAWKAKEVDFNGWTFEQINAEVDYVYGTAQFVIRLLEYEDPKIYNWHVKVWNIKHCGVRLMYQTADMYNCYFDRFVTRPLSSNSTFWQRTDTQGVQVLASCRFHYSVINSYTEECNMIVPDGEYNNSELYVHYKYTGNTATKTKHSAFLYCMARFRNSYVGGVIDVSEGTGSFAITDPSKTGGLWDPGAYYSNSIINIKFLVSENCTISPYNNNTTFTSLGTNVKSYFVIDNGNNYDNMGSVPVAIRCTGNDIINPERLSADNFPYINDDDVRYSQYDGKSPNLFYGGLQQVMYNPGTGEPATGVTSWVSSVEAIPVSPDTEYTFSAKKYPEESMGLFTLEYDRNMTFLSYGYTAKTPENDCRTWTTSSNTKYIRVEITGSSRYYYPSDFEDFNLNLGGEELPYVPYGDRTGEDWRWRQNAFVNDGVPFLPFWFYPIYVPPVIYPTERAERISVYDISEPQSGFDHNGVAVLCPSEVISTKEDKGRWDIEIVHPIDQWGKWTYIIGQNVVKVNGQLFRVDEVETYLDADAEYVTAHAKHISYDMSDVWINEANFSANGGTNYYIKLYASRVKDFPNQQHVVGEYVFNVTSDITGTMECAIEDQNLIEALFGADNSFINRYGGELYRDNFNMTINQHLEGADNAFSIRYGQDLTKISFKIDFSQWITNLICVDNFGSLVGVWYDTSGDWMVHHHKTKRVHFTYAELVDPDYAIERLDKDTMNLWAQVSTPIISIEIKVAAIKNDPKYKDFLNLQNFDVGYSGQIYVEHLGIDVSMKIVSIRRNELTGEAISITLGNSRGSLIRQTVLSQTIVPNGSIEAKQEAAIAQVQQELFDTNTTIMAQSIGNMQDYAISDIEKRSIAQLEGLI